MTYDYFERDFIVKEWEKNGMYHLGVYRKGTHLKINACPFIFTKTEERSTWLQTYREAYVNGMKDLAKIDAYKKTFKNPYKSGDIFYRVWGENIAFYEVVKVSAFTVKFNEIKCTWDKRVFSTKGTTMPIKGSYTGNSVTKSLIFTISHQQVFYFIRDLILWDGNPVPLPQSN